jgi:NAD(P)-dependent dehydrogenase (short-subunit alcohol dehydrogenase family)
MAFEPFELTGKRALVTGSSQGIGFALAQGLAEHGAEVVLNGRDAAKLDAAAAKLASAGHKVSEAAFDVTQSAGREGRSRGDRAKFRCDQYPGQQCRYTVPPAARGLSRRKMCWVHGSSGPKCREARRRDQVEVRRAPRAFEARRLGTVCDAVQ